MKDGTGEADVKLDGNEAAQARRVAEEYLAMETPPETPAKPEKKPAKTPNAGNEVPGAEVEAEESEAAAETEETEADDLSQAATEETETETEESREGREEGEEAEEPAEVEAEAEEPPKQPPLKEILASIPGLKPEHQTAIGKKMHEVVSERVGTAIDRMREKVSGELAAEKSAREAAEAKVAELEGASAPAQQGENPLSKVATVAALEQEAAKQESVLEDVERLLPELSDNPEWVEAQLRAAKVPCLNPKTGEPDYSPERMRATLERFKTNAERTLRRHIPARRDQLEQSQAFNAEALNHFPALKDPANKFTQHVNALAKKMPELARLPYGKLILANVAYAGVAQAKAKVAATPPKTPPVVKAPLPKAKPAVTIAAGKPSARAGAESAELVAAKKRFEATHSDKDLAALIAAGG